MMRIFFFSLCLLISWPLWAAGGESKLMHANVNLSDKNSLQRGSRIFVNYCLSCHSAAYMRFNRLGQDLGISEEILQANLMFGTNKTGDSMTISMTKDDAEQYFGVVPPDLSVLARARGADWLYTYFMTFYRDKSRPWGVNNLAFKDTAMPHVLWDLQGWQRPVYEEETGPDGSSVMKIDHLEYESTGKLTEEEYAKMATDLVNFMVYLGEPVKLKRYKIGYWVIIYLFIFLVIVYLLKKEYWRDIH